jgi:hypothetical protein
LKERLIRAVGHIILNNIYFEKLCIERKLDGRKTYLEERTIFLSILLENTKIINREKWKTSLSQ